MNGNVRTPVRYFGSVAFFRRLIMVSILYVLPITLIALATVSILFVSTASRQQRQIEDLKQQLNALQPAASDQTAAEPTPKLFSAETDRPASSLFLALPVETTWLKRFEVPVIRPAAGETGTGSRSSVPDTTQTNLSPVISEPTQPVSGVIVLSPTPTVPAVAAQPGPTPATSAPTTPAKVAYLTFDDGPSPRTLEILDILDRYQIKATFFVTNSGMRRYPSIMRQTAASGHAIGMHSATHQYEKIYKNQTAYLADLQLNARMIRDLTGQNPRILRFPGGSYNDYNRSLAPSLTAVVRQLGYVYYDWNCITGDAMSRNVPASQLVKNVMLTANTRKKLIILCHDATSKHATVEALPTIIEQLQKKGFTLLPLDPTVKPITFG